MKIAIALTLLLAADCVASSTTQPTLLTCTLKSANAADTSETMVVNEKIETATDDNYIAARATAAKDVMIEGARYKVTADGGYGMNSDGSMYLPNLTLQVREEATGWSAESRAGEHTTVSLAHARSATRGLISCHLQ